MIALTFPFRIISKDNFKCFNRRGIPFLSKEFKEFERLVGWHAKRQYEGKILDCDLYMVLTAYFRNKTHSDIGNLPKSCLDALQGIIYKNDRQIKQLKITVVEGVPKDYFEIELEGIL